MTIAWTTYEAEIQFRDRCIGGIPLVTPDQEAAGVYSAWQHGQKVVDDPAFAEPLAAVLAVDPDMPIAEETGQGFRRDDEQGLYLEARQVKAMLKEAAQRLGYIKNTRGTRQVLQHDLHVRAVDGSQKLYLARTEPDGVDMRPISVITPQGPRTSLKRFEYVTAATLRFRVKVLAGGLGEGLIGDEQLHDMLELGGELGLGADRSQGEGTFDLVTIEVCGI